MKAGMKQQNLFGQPAVENTNKGPDAKGKKKTVGKEKVKADLKKKSKSPLPDAAGGDGAKGKGSEVMTADNQDAQTEGDSQATSNFDTRVQEVETQLEETQLDGSSPGDIEVETQPTTETQTEEEEIQVDEDAGEPVSHFA